MTVGNKVLFSAMKNEGPFILEWVAYHRVIGFDRIIICSNDSDDGTTELLDALDAAGYIEHITNEVPKGVGAQRYAAKVINERQLIRKEDWFIWLDADEFLNIHVGDRTVDALIERMGPAMGIMLCWRIFGDGGNKRFTGRFLSKEFSTAAMWRSKTNRHIKSFSKFVDGVEGVCEAGIHRLKLSSEHNIDANKVLNGKGFPLDMSHKYNTDWFMGKDDERNCKVARNDFGWRVAQINHYCIRTPEYYALKNVRGRGWAATADGTNDRHTAEFYHNNNRNDELDDTILFWENKVTFEIDVMLENEAISKCHNQTIDRSNLKIEKIADRIKYYTVPPYKIPKVTLPVAETKLLIEEYSKAKTILEYGSGGSTLLAAADPHKTVISVESDLNWTQNLRNAILGECPETSSAFIHYVNIGPTKEWGYPVNDNAWQQYHKYPLDVWDQPFFKDPDIILIDGRFRLACFATAMLRVTKPTIILYDDYVDRPEYHVVESLIKPTRIAGRMAQFVIEPGKIDKSRLTEIIGWYSVLR